MNTECKKAAYGHRTQILWQKKIFTLAAIVLDGVWPMLNIERQAECVVPVSCEF